MRIGTPSFSKGRLLGALVSAALVALAGCSEKPEDECAVTAQKLIEPIYRIHYVITKAGGGAYTGEVHFQSEKHYCDGRVSGVFTDEALTTQNGYWKPITTQYKLANRDDYVLMTFSTATYDFPHTYSYDDVMSGMFLEDYTTWVFEDTLHVEVPL